MTGAASLARPTPSDAPFFGGRRAGDAGLVLFLNAGDPSFDVLEDIVLMLDACRVDCLELAVPFPNSISDGPVIRRSAERALAGGTDLEGVLAFVAAIRPRLNHLKIALLADWSHTVKAHSLPDFLARVRGSGSDAVLIHGLPPRLRQPFYEAAHDIGQPVVTTCYATSAPAILEEAARHATGYLYLVAHYGKTGTTPAQGYDGLAPVITTLRGFGAASVAVGFGVKNRTHVDGLGAIGADAAIVGSAGVARIEQALSEGPDLIGDFEAFVRGLLPSARAADASLPHPSVSS